MRIGLKIRYFKENRRKIHSVILIKGREIAFGSCYYDVLKIEGTRNWEVNNLLDVKRRRVYFIWLSLAYVAGGFVSAGEGKKGETLLREIQEACYLFLQL